MKRISSPAASPLPHDGHPMLEMTTLAGAAAGAATGAIGGPPGILLGSVIGAATGMIAGSVLEAESQRAADHDEELDGVIGVRGGSLGAGAFARGGLEAALRREGTGTISGNQDLAGGSELLRREHERLEALYDRLLAAYRQGDWNDVSKQWRAFEAALRAHIALEEALVFPLLRETDPTTTQSLEAEHAELVTLLETLGVNLELHAVTMHDAEELILRLRGHAERETRILYPWLDATFSLDPAAS